MRGTAAAVLGLALAGLACSRGAVPAPAAASRQPPGGKIMNGVSVQRLGKVVPGEMESRLIDPRPVVLWSGESPAAVLLYRNELLSESGPVEQELAPIPESVDGQLRAAGGGFPVTYRTKVARSSEAELFDKPDLGAIYAADVNGDGMDELVIAKQTGGVDLVGWKKVLARYPAPSHRPEVASYRARGAQVVRLEGRAEVYLLFERIVNAKGQPEAKELERAGAGDPYVLLRVDGQGITPVLLGKKSGWADDVLAVGAVNRPGSNQVDELVALWQKGRGDAVYMSRHRPDGALIGEPRQVYVPLSWSWSDGYPVFIPQSRVILLVSGQGQVYFLEAEKPVNWIRRVDLKALAGVGRASYLGSADGATSVKALVAVEEPAQAVYAVDAEGRFYTTGDGALTPASRPAPLYRIQPRSELHAIEVLPSATREDEFLVVQSCEPGTRKLTRPEIDQAAERFLKPEEVAAERHEAEPTLEGEDPIRDPLIAKERRTRGVHQEIKTVEEWRRLLPDSYAAMVREGQDDLYAALKALLVLPLDKPSMLTPGDYRDLEAYREWLAGIEKPAEVHFDLVRRGTVARSFQVKGALARSLSTPLIRDWVEWRAGSSGLVAVATLAAVGAGAEAEPGVYLVRVDAGRR